MARSQELLFPSCLKIDTMAFTQLIHREILRAIEAYLRHRAALAYPMGIRGKVTRTNLAYADAIDLRDWRVFSGIAGVLMRRTQRLCADVQLPILDMEVKLFALDVAVIELSMALFSRVRWKSNHASVKLNILQVLRGDIPVFASLHGGKHHEVASLYVVPIMLGS